MHTSPGFSFALLGTLERVLNALRLVGRDELQPLIAEQARVESRYEFCGKRYEVSATRLADLFDHVDASHRLGPVRCTDSDYRATDVGIPAAIASNRQVAGPPVSTRPARWLPMLLMRVVRRASSGAVAKERIKPALAVQDRRWLRNPAWRR